MATSAIKRWLKRFDVPPRVLSQDSMEKRRVFAWTVQAVIVSRKITIKKRVEGKRANASGLFHSDCYSEGRIVVYRGYFIRLLTAHKTLRDQLLVELPTLEGLRTGEVSCSKAEYVDLERGDLQVLDSKKHQLFVIPLDPVVASHLAEYINEQGITEGLLFPPREIRNPRRAFKRGTGLTVGAIQSVWERCCKLAGIPVMSPRLGRAYFAVKWAFVEHKSIYGLMAVLRHQDILATQKYLAKIIDYDDVKAEFNRGKKTPFSHSCLHSVSCPLMAEGCYCRMFQPQIEVTQT